VEEFCFDQCLLVPHVLLSDCCRFSVETGSVQMLILRQMSRRVSNQTLVKMMGGWLIAVALIFIVYSVSSRTPPHDEAAAAVRMHAAMDRALDTVCLPQRRSKSGNVAIMIELRPHIMILPVLTNFLSQLPAPDWRIQLWYSKDNKEFVEKQCARLASTGKVELVYMPPLPEQQTRPVYWYNFLVTAPKFWTCSSGDWVIIFQSDTVLCSSSPYRVVDFMRPDVDFVGAPWTGWNRSGSNGGLSLRRRSAMLDMTLSRPLLLNDLNEDAYFVNTLIERKRGGRTGLLPFEEASKFSVQNFCNGPTFGVHQIHRQNWAERYQCLEHCPEAGMLFSHYLSRAPGRAVLDAIARVWHYYTS